MFGSKQKIERPDSEIFVYFDSKSKSYGQPMFAINQHAILRDITNMFRDPERQKDVLYTNAEDFSVFKIGYYDKSTGKIHSQELEHIANLHDLRALVPTTANFGGYATQKDGTQVPMGIVPT